MPIPKSLLNYLDQNKVKYETIEHKTVFTAKDSAETQKINPRQVLKTLVMKLDAKECVLALLPSDRNLDKVKFKSSVNIWKKKRGEKIVKNADFAKEVWMKKNILGKVGATPPLGKLLKMPVFIDNSALKNQKIIVNSGDYDYSLKLAAKQFEKLEEPVKGNFSLPKPKKHKSKKTLKHKNKKASKQKNDKSKKQSKRPAKRIVKKPVKKIIKKSAKRNAKKSIKKAKKGE